MVEYLMWVALVGILFSMSWRLAKMDDRLDKLEGKDDE